MWKKKNKNINTIKDVVLKNTGLTEKDLFGFVRDTIVNLDKSANIVISAIKNHKKITIVGDYDADGVTASSILYLFFTKIGYKNVDVILPRRFSDGYGISANMVSQIKSGLVITVDNGIAAFEEIKTAKDKGLDVIILDHHLAPENGVLPNADVIVDPNAIKGSDFSSYCGAGLAYKLVSKILSKTKNPVKYNEFLEQLSSLAAIGTVADVVELLFDNRNIVIKGLKAINERKVPLGLNVLLDELGKQDITEDDIGFLIAPVINASGRMKDDGAKAVFEVLTAQIDSEKLRDEIKVLIETNQERKELVEKNKIIADRIIEKYKLSDNNILFIYSTKEDKEQFFSGVAGLIAGRLSEQYKVPAFVLSESKDGVLTGSGRCSREDLNLKEILDKASKYILRYGGHKSAAGLSVEKNKIKELKDFLIKELSKPEYQRKDDNNYYDLEISVEEIEESVKELEKYAPFGAGNPKIIFKVKDFKLEPCKNQFFRYMGKNSDTLKLFGKDKISAVGFSLVPLYEELEKPMLMDLYGKLSVNNFMDNKEYQVELLDIEKKETKKTETNFKNNLSQLLNKRLKEK